MHCWQHWVRPARFSITLYGVGCQVRVSTGTVLSLDPSFSLLQEEKRRQGDVASYFSMMLLELAFALAELCW